MKLRNYLNRDPLSILIAKLIVINIAIVIVISAIITLGMVFFHMYESRPSSQKQGYHNPVYYKIETEALECIVMNPLVNCSMTAMIERTQQHVHNNNNDNNNNNISSDSGGGGGGGVNMCRGLVKYKNLMNGEEVTAMTHNQFKTGSKFALYSVNQRVTCYYDAYRSDMVSYLRETNVHFMFGRLVLIAFLCNLSVLILETIGLTVYGLYRRKKILEWWEERRSLMLQ